MSHNAPHDQSMLAKLRKVWTAAELNSEWATTRIDDLDEANPEATENHPHEARYESIQARMESVQKCCEFAAQAIERRNNGYEEEGVWLSELDITRRIHGYEEGYRFSDHKTGMAFKTIESLNDYLRQDAPEQFSATASTELANQPLDHMGTAKD